DTDVVVLPSPALVGVIAETQMTLASGASDRRSITSRLILALYLPYRSTSSSSMPISRATSMIGRSTASCAISRLLFTYALLLVLVSGRRPPRRAPTQDRSRRTWPSGTAGSGLASFRFPPDRRS